MTWPVIVILAGAPRGKARPRRAPNGTHVYIDAEARKYESQLRYAATKAMAGRAPLAEAVRVEVEIRFPIPESWPRKKQAAAELGHLRPCRVPDCDNVLKQVDCLSGVVFVDDKQIVEARVVKLYSRHPGLTIIVAPVTLPEWRLPAKRDRQSAAGDLFAASL